MKFPRFLDTLGFINLIYVETGFPHTNGRGEGERSLTTIFLVRLCTEW